MHRTEMSCLPVVGVARLDQIFGTSGTVPEGGLAFESRFRTRHIICPDITMVGGLPVQIVRKSSTPPSDPGFWPKSAQAWISDTAGGV